MVNPARGDLDLGLVVPLSKQRARALAEMPTSCFHEARGRATSTAGAVRHARISLSRRHFTTHRSQLRPLVNTRLESKESESVPPGTRVEQMVIYGAQAGQIVPRLVIKGRSRRGYEQHRRRQFQRIALETNEKPVALAR